ASALVARGRQPLAAGSARRTSAASAALGSARADYAPASAVQSAPAFGWRVSAAAAGDGGDGAGGAGRSPQASGSERGAITTRPRTMTTRASPGTATPGSTSVTDGARPSRSCAENMLAARGGVAA